MLDEHLDMEEGDEGSSDGDLGEDGNGNATS